ncbi:MAG: hypothetical protein KCHDKBKB_01710 [Elusimicrobia bacterium]|nr:hypothetical protein [Elusimicrobiota bacterium]
MNSLAKSLETYFVATHISFDEDFICIKLVDGREVKVPIEFYPKIKNAKSKQRKNFRLIGMGTGIHWPDLDEDLSVEGLVLGRKVPER